MDNKLNNVEKARYCEQTYFYVKAVFENEKLVDIDTPFRLSNKSFAVGFMLDEGNEDIMVATTNEENMTTPVKWINESDLKYVSFFGLPLEDRDEIARVIDNGEYTLNR